MLRRKTTKKYYFSVEGETEQWYFERLKELINNTPEATYTVSFVCNIKDPLKNAKGVTVTQPIDITYVFDYESNDSIHTTQFKTTLERMKKAETIGKRISYKLGYSNFSFELWIVIHKNECYKPFTNRNQYLEPINRAYGECFVDLDQYKAG